MNTITQKELHNLQKKGFKVAKIEGKPKKENSTNEYIIQLTDVIYTMLKKMDKDAVTLNNSLTRLASENKDMPGLLVSKERSATIKPKLKKFRLTPVRDTEGYIDYVDVEEK